MAAADENVTRLQLILVQLHLLELLGRYQLVRKRSDIGLSISAKMRESGSSNADIGQLRARGLAVGGDLIYLPVLLFRSSKEP